MDSFSSCFSSGDTRLLYFRVLLLLLCRNACSALDGVVNLWEVQSGGYVLVFLLSLSFVALLICPTCWLIIRIICSIIYM